MLYPHLSNSVVAHPSFRRLNSDTRYYEPGASQLSPDHLMKLLDPVTVKRAVRPDTSGSNMQSKKEDNTNFVSV